MSKEKENCQSQTFLRFETQRQLNNTVFTNSPLTLQLNKAISAFIKYTSEIGALKIIQNKSAFKYIKLVISCLFF